VTTPELSLEAVHLSKSYGRSRSRGVVDVDLELPRGQVIGLVGANGAGKTTLMRTILNFIRPTNGRLLVLGMDSRRGSVEIRRRTTYLPGELVLPPRLNGHEIVRRFAFTRSRGDRARVNDLAEMVQLDLGRRAGDLSKGNKQKLGLVLAFAPRADLLVLDEPTSGLDPFLQRQFATLAQQAADDGATVLLSSHVMSEVEAVAGSVVLMRQGRIAAFDRLADIQARARRRVRIRPSSMTDLVPLRERLTHLAGVRELEVNGADLTCALSGSPDDLIGVLSTVSLVALDIGHADLEDAFFAAYDEPDPTPDGA
jgi:ABC-2 type transport system ATP-binding protein